MWVLTVPSDHISLDLSLTRQGVFHGAKARKYWGSGPLGLLHKRLRKTIR